MDTSSNSKMGSMVCFNEKRRNGPDAGLSGGRRPAMTGYMRKVVQTVKHTHARPFRHWRACASLHLKGARQIRFTARDVFLWLEDCQRPRPTGGATGGETWPLHSCTPLHPSRPCTGNCNQVRSWAGFWWCCLLYVWVSLVPGVCVSFGDLSYGGGQSGSACCTRSDHPWPEAHALPFFFWLLAVRSSLP
jgi:hypothetical protein